MNSNSSRSLTGIRSLVLDILRLGSAVVVVYNHAGDMWFPSTISDPTQPGNPAHAAVVIFFVISGYVISNTTDVSSRGPLSYAQARLTRLCSVLIPALFVTGIVQFLVSFLNPDLLGEYSRGSTFLRLLISGMFLNEIWFFSAAPPLNIPLWSLSFEFWYYVIFGLFYYRSSGWKSYTLPLLACLLAGPKILLMMPVWFCGYLAYNLRQPIRNPNLQFLLFGAAFAVAMFAIFTIKPMPYAIESKPFFFANQFLTDWIVGLLIGAALWILPSGSAQKSKAKFILWFRKIADLTFPLYVLHFPLLVLWRSMFDFQVNSETQFLLALAWVFTLSSGLGILLNQQRWAWSLLFQRSLDLVPWKRLISK